MAPATERIHILGASGSGTTTLGKALARTLGLRHLDTDDYYWEPTDPPFTVPRPLGERLGLLNAALDEQAGWVLSGSLMGWGDALIPRFTRVIFLYVPREARLARLLARERARYGAEVEPGGRLHQKLLDFIAWAEGYDDSRFEGRSLSRHRNWLARIRCPVIEIEGTPTVEESLARVVEAR